MKTRWLAAKYMNREDDWRASYHLSAAAVLSEKGENWPNLGKVAPQCLEGWRVSTNPTSLAYDSRIETSPAYRMRHVGLMTLDTDSRHWHPPEISGEPFCVQPFDVLVRKVGEVKAALALPRHGRHPADGNLGIIRGLLSEQTVWLSWCINQPLYKAWLENTDTLSPLIRVGLKRLKEMPLAPYPESFTPLAKRFISVSEEIAEAHFQLSILRKEVSQWVESWQAGLEDDITLDLSKRRSRWFKSADIGNTWLMPYTEQRALARKCLEEYAAQPIAHLARINPTTLSSQLSKQPGSLYESRSLRIRDMDNQMGYAQQLPLAEHTAWRLRQHALQKYDVLVSSFAQDSKVGFIERQPECITRPSEQLMTLAFHKYQGAYALIMETPFIKSQLARLASGSVQLFIPPALVSRLVLPPVNEQAASRWHHQLVKCLNKASAAKRQLAELTEPMQRIYDHTHSQQRDATRPPSSLNALLKGRP